MISRKTRLFIDVLLPASLRNVEIYCCVSVVLVYSDGSLQSQQQPSVAVIRRVYVVSACLPVK